MHHVQHAIQLYEKHGGDFGYALQWHLAHGVVVSAPDCFMLGFFCSRDQPWDAIEVGKADCVHVTMCIGNMRVAGMQIVEAMPYIAYQRQFKNDSRLRITNFRKFYNKLK